MEEKRVKVFFTCRWNNLYSEEWREGSFRPWNRTTLFWLLLAGLRIRITLINTDPDPSFHFNADPDSTFHFNSYPDPNPAPS
jgi:hypothetical protein